MATQFSVKEGRRWQFPFFSIWGGQALSLLGSQLVQFALIWYLTIETGSATVLATASLVGLLPYVIFGPIIGTLVDRWDRRLVMLVADGSIALFTILLAVLFATGRVEIWHIYLVMFARSVAGGFHGNAMSASTALMVPVEHLTRIQGVNQMLNGGLNVISAPLGALLLDFLPLQGILAIDVVTAVFAIVPLFFIKVPQPERIERNVGKNGDQPTVWQDFKEGLRYMAGWPGLLMLGLMAILINFLLTPAGALLPLLVKDYFNGGAIELGWVNSAAGIGVILGGSLLGIWGGFKRKIVTTFVGLFGLGAGVLILALAPPTTILWAVVASLIYGTMQPITNGPIGAPDMQARVGSLLGSMASGMAPIGVLIAGPISDRVGIQTWFLIGGILCMFMAIIGFFIPALMKIEEGNQVSDIGMEKPESVTIVGD